MHIFFASRSTRKIRGVTDAGLKPRRLQRMAVIGGGLMGSGIATACTLAGMDVLLKEVNQQFLDVSAGANMGPWCSLGLRLGYMG